MEKSVGLGGGVNGENCGGWTFHVAEGNEILWRHVRGRIGLAVQELAIDLQNDTLPGRRGQKTSTPLESGRR